MSDTDPSGASGDSPSAALPKPDPAEAAPAEDKPARPSRLPWVLGTVVLVLLAAASGGLIAIYGPRLAGIGPDAALADRVSALESGSPQADAAGFAGMQRSLAALKSRLDADEARLAAVEGASGGSADTGSLKAAIDKNSSDIAQLGQRMDSLAAAPQTGADTGAGAHMAGRLAGDEKTLASLRSDFDAQVKATSDTLDKLGAQIGALEKSAPPADLKQQLDGFGTRIAGLEKTAPPADLAERLDALATKSQLDALQMRVGHLEDQDLAGLVQRAASVMALADLVRASEREEPFANELKALRAVMPDSAEIIDLAKYAGAGVPTVPTLTTRFEDNIDPILAAERAAQARNWAEKAWSDIVNLISVRKVGNVSGSDTEARVARAEFALRHGDLDAAVHEVERLDTPAKHAAAPWLKDARARLAVNRDGRVLTNRVVTALAAAQAAVKSETKPQTGAQ